MPPSEAPEAPVPTTPHPEREPSPSFWRGQRVLVTGGGGFLGSHLVDRLRALGARIERVATDPPVPA